MLFQVVVDLPQVRRGGRRPAKLHLRIQHLGKPFIHLPFIKQLSSLRLGNTLGDGGSESGILVEETQRSIFDEIHFHFGHSRSLPIGCQE